MSFDLTSITAGKASRAPRILLLGVEKIGKSTFSSRAPGAVVLPIKGEEGMDALDCAKFPTAQKYDDVLNAITALYSEEHDYRAFVIDSASALEPLIHDATAKRCGTNSIETVHGGFGKGYSEACAEWRQVLDGLDALRAQRDMITIVIGHVSVKPFNDPTSDSYDAYIFDVNKKAAELIQRWADVILFANRRIAVKKEEVGFNKTKARATGGTEPMLYTQKRPAHPGGGRGEYGQVPYELPLDWKAYWDAVERARQS